MYYKQMVLGLTSFKLTPLVQYVVKNQKIDTISSLDAGVLWAVEVSIYEEDQALSPQDTRMTLLMLF